MAKRRSVGKKKRADAASEALPQFDQQWLTALIILARVFRDNHIRCDQTPEALRRSLRKLEPDKLFGVIAECLYMMLNPPGSSSVPHPSLREERGTDAGAAKKSRVKKGPSKRERRAIA